MAVKSAITTSSPRKGPALARTFLAVSFIAAENGWARISCAPGGHAHDFGFGPLRARAHLGELAATHHADRIAETDELGQVAADDQHGLSLRRELADELVDLRLAA